MFGRFSKGFVALVLAGLLLLFCGAAWAEEVTIIDSGSCGANVTWQLDSAGVLTISGSGEMDDFTASPWYSHNTGIMSVVIQDGVTSIGDWAFDSCSSLTAITIPDGVTSIGNYAFYGCPAVLYTSCNSSAALALGKAGYSFVDPAYPLLTLLAGETEEGNRTLIVTGCDVSATEIVIPDGVTSIDYSAFNGCSSLTSVSIPDSVTSICSSAFEGCSSLTAITIPDSVTSIGDWTFYGCSSLASVSIPDGITSIGDLTFSNCSSLTSVSIPDSVTSIGYEAFGGCSSLTSITIPDGVTSIGDSAFNGCTSLTSASLSDGITSIGTRVFFKCSSLVSITLPDSVTSIGDYAFYNCSSLTAVNIPDGVTSINEYAFSGCHKLTSITLPQSVTSIGNGAFSSSGITQIAFLNEGCTAFGSNVVFEKITVYCYEFSEAEFWADDNGHTIVYLNALEEEKPVQINLPSDATMQKGETLVIAADIFPAFENMAIAWSSSAPEIVSVQDGVLTAHSGGDAIITASCGDVSDTMNVHVEVSLESFELPADEMWIVSKETAQLALASIQPVDATEIVSWSSSSTSVNISESGLISARTPGEAVVTATARNGFSRSMTVHVCRPVTAIAFESVSDTLVAGSQLQLTANVTAGTELLINKLVTFQSSDEAIITVSPDGLVTALSYGTAEIIATASSGVTATCSISVICAAHEEIADQAVPATCTESGLTEGSHCGVCGAILVAQETVPATGHSVRFGQDVYEVTVGKTSDIISASFTCGHHVELQVHIPDNLTLVSWNGSSVTVSGNEPGVATLSFEVDDEFRNRASCKVVVHAAEQMILPSALTAIDEEAFTNLSAEEVVLSHKVESIGARAFADCKNLVLINLPDGVQIAEDAFDGCEQLTILCSEGSTGHAYATEHEMPYLILSSDDVNAK